jgi:hypothetical protein
MCVCVFILPKDEEEKKEFSVKEFRFEEEEECARGKTAQKKEERDERGPRRGGGGRRIRIRHARSSGE